MSKNLGEYPIPYIFYLVGQAQKKKQGFITLKTNNKEHPVHEVRISRRLKTFLGSITCKHCLKSGNTFILNLTKENIHLDLMLKEKDSLLLFTSDHITPVSRGGSIQSMKNRQTLCVKCNSKKGNKLEHKIRQYPQRMAFIFER